MENGHPKVTVFIHLAPRRHASSARKGLQKQSTGLMATGQTPFPYTDEQLQTLTMFISLERLAMYQ